ncbi:MAG: hypothetical protein EOP84_20160 [Verrucomicrobiaceae bacterium]|nr:MAG: hypothetical protein EOP84_20160 [Verrucomicrobiaceae bacterium]
MVIAGYDPRWLIGTSVALYNALSFINELSPPGAFPLKTASKLILLAIVAWAAGLLAYVVSLAAFYRQSISHGDFVAVVVWSAIGFFLAFVAVYLPALLGLRRLLGGVRPAWPFPLASILLGVAPTAFVLLYWGGGLRSLFSSEASLFYSMFSVIGILLGLGYVRIHRQMA